MPRERKPPSDPLVMKVNELLDAMRAEHQVTSDEALAHAIGVNKLTIWRWRTGQLDKTARILVDASLRHAGTLEAA